MTRLDTWKGDGYFVFKKRLPPNNQEMATHQSGKEMATHQSGSEMATYQSGKEMVTPPIWERIWPPIHLLVYIGGDGHLID